MQRLFTWLAFLTVAAVLMLAPDQITRLADLVYSAPDVTGYSLAALTTATLIRRGVDFVGPDGVGSQLWTYTTNDDAATMIAANYFNGAADILVKYSVIDAIGVWNGTPIHKRYLVTANNGTTVTVVAIY